MLITTWTFRGTIARKAPIVCVNSTPFVADRVPRPFAVNLSSNSLWMSCDVPEKSNRKHIVTVAAQIHAAPARLYGILADYRNGHPSILPAAFSGLTVERGGTGAGTIIRFRMRVFGRTQTFRATVTEPEPGRVLVETYLETNGAITTFTVNPGPDQGTSAVTISTELPIRAGVLGVIERALTTRFLRPLYVRELELLAARGSVPKDVDTS